jgi:hypothetical protein
MKLKNNLMTVGNLDNNNSNIGGGINLIQILNKKYVHTYSTCSFVRCRIFFFFLQST